jgi:hypothetical protein
MAALAALTSPEPCVAVPRRRALPSRGARGR